jgi:hypothetical protein
MKQRSQQNLSGFAGLGLALALIRSPYEETLGRFILVMADNGTEIDAVLGKAGNGGIGQI